jgi:DNA (cytosine-5)-methyltransferase 1
LEVVRSLAEFFSLRFVVFENVLGIKDAKHASTFRALLDGLMGLGLHVTENQLCSLDFGVAQIRNRVIVAGLDAVGASAQIKPRSKTGPKSLQEVIGGLNAPAFFSRAIRPSDIPEHPNHWTMRPLSKRFSQDINEWRSGRSFRRTFWEKPSPTIAFGHREIHVHPNCKRRLSIFEAMLLQGFPRCFVLKGNLSQQVELVSNAVPPPLARSVAMAVKRSLRASK